MKEIHVASGGPWGGTNVNAAFTEILVKLWGEDFIKHVKSEIPAIWWKLQNDVEFFKRVKVMPPNSSGKVCAVSIPLKIATDFKTIKGKDVLDSAVGPNITGVEINSDGCIVLSPAAVKDLFQPTVNKVIDFLMELFKVEALSKVDYLFMVGGFSCSQHLTSAIKERFSQKTTIMIPEEPTTVIMKGALMFSKNPTFVKERLARATYGINAMVPFNPAVHDESRSLVFDGKKECKGTFEIFIRKGTAFKLGHAIEKTFTTESTDCGEIMVDLFACPREDVVYVDEEDVSKIGKIYVKIVDNKPGSYHLVDVSFYLGESEMKITVNDTYGKQTQVEKRVVFQHR